MRVPSASTHACAFPTLLAAPSQVRDSLGRLVELPVDTHPGHYRRETATIHSSAIVRLATELRAVPPGARPPAWAAAHGVAPGVGRKRAAARPALQPLRPAPCCSNARAALHRCRALASPRPLPPGSTLFIEIKHWKSDKRRFSTLAWAAAPLDRLVDAGQHSARVGGWQLLPPLQPWCRSRKACVLVGWGRSARALPVVGPLAQPHPTHAYTPLRPLPVCRCGAAPWTCRCCASRWISRCARRAACPAVAPTCT